jgi:hypothetical protein
VTQIKIPHGSRAIRVPEDEAITAEKHDECTDALSPRQSRPDSPVRVEVPEGRVAVDVVGGQKVAVDAEVKLGDQVRPGRQRRGGRLPKGKCQKEISPPSPITMVRPSGENAAVKDPGFEFDWKIFRPLDTSHTVGSAARLIPIRYRPSGLNLTPRGPPSSFLVHMGRWVAAFQTLNELVSRVPDASSCEPMANDLPSGEKAPTQAKLPFGPNGIRAMSVRLRTVPQLDGGFFAEMRRRRPSGLSASAPVLSSGRG